MIQFIVKNSIGGVFQLKALVHYNWNCKKKVVIVHTHYNFFSQLQQFFQQFYIWATSFTTIFRKNRCENLCSVRGPLGWFGQTAILATAGYFVFKLWFYSWSHATNCLSAITIFHGPNSSNKATIYMYIGPIARLWWLHVYDKIIVYLDSSL